MHTFRKLAAALFLFALLVPLAASATGPKAVSHQRVKAAPSRASLVSRAWSLALGTWDKIRSGVDPNGGPVPVPGSGSQTDIGLGIDPDGSHGS